MSRFLILAAWCCVGCANSEPAISPALARALALPALGLGGSGAELSFEVEAAGFTRTDERSTQRWRLSALEGEVRVERAGAPALTVTPLASPCPVGPGQLRGTSVVYPGLSGDCAVVVAARSDGLKEDLVLARELADQLSFSWRLGLAQGLEARRAEDGSVAILARGRPRYRFPAPVVRDASGREDREVAHFELEGDTLRLVASGLSALQYPLTIDPTLLVTHTPDFAQGGNDEGNVSMDLDRLQRVKTQGGPGDWSLVSTFPTARKNFATVFTPSYLYVIGGNGGSTLSDVQVARLGPGAIVSAWLPATPLVGPREHLAAVAYNGFLYVSGGYDGAAYQSTVHRAALKPDGTLGSFVPSGSLPGPRGRHTSVAWGNRLYVLGGTDGVSHLNDVLVAPIHGDGSLGAFGATTPFPGPRSNHATVVHDGALYVLGGFDGAARGDIQFAPISRSGQVGGWTATGPLPSPRASAAVTVFGGSLHLSGGIDGAPLADVRSAALEANGTLGPWISGPSLSTARSSHGLVAHQGALYVLGGEAAGGVRADVQVAALGAAPSPTGWPSTTPLPLARSSHASAVFNGFVYVSGGDPGNLSDVRYAPLGTDGTVGAWASTTALPGPRSGHGMVAVNRFLYTVGGYNGSLLENTVHVAPIAADGTVGAWVATASFVNGRYEHMLVVSNGYLYVLGGYKGGTLDDVQFAPINPDGTLGAFTLTTALPLSRYSAAAVVYDGFLYVTGGWSTTGSASLNDVHFAAINADGTLGPFVITASFLTPRLAHTAVVHHGSLYVVAGDTNAPTYFGDVQAAPITSAGGLGPFVTVGALPSPRSGHTSVVHAGSLFVLGGANGSDLSEVLSARLASNGVLSPFVAATPFPSVSYAHTSVIANGYLYVVGGFASGPVHLADVRYAPISPGGAVGTWLSTTPLPSGRDSHASVIANGFVYVIGGKGALGPSAEVLFAALNPDGSLGPWTATTPLPGVLDSHTAAVWNGHLYVLGGAFQNTVWEAPLNADGTLGAWTMTTPFIEGRRRHATVVYNGFIYVIGGYGTGSRYLDTVEVAPLLADGSIGAWKTTTSLPDARYCHSSVAFGGYLYVIAGQNTGTLSSVEVAPINANGTLGSWSGTSPLAQARLLQGVALDHGNLYVTGGLGVVDTLNDVEVARLLTPAPRAVYSKLFDFGATLASIDSITVGGPASGNGSKVLLDYQVAPASGVFGATAVQRAITPGAPSTLAEANARYLWVRLVLDDSEAALVAPDALNEREVTDLTIAFTEVDAGSADAGTDAGVADAGPGDAGLPLAPRLVITVERARCEVPYLAAPVVEGDGPFQFSLQGAELPEGLTVDPSTGELSWTPARSQRRAVFELVVTGPGGFDKRAIDLEVDCGPKAYRVGCSSAGGPLALLVLLAFALRQRTRGSTRSLGARG